MLVVEFIGVTGVGKSTLVAATSQFLSAQGLRVGDAEQAVVAQYGLAFPDHPKVRSALACLLALPKFGRYLFTREGTRLARLAFDSIGQGMGNYRTGINLVRNFVKRIGSHLLLEEIRNQIPDFDILIWDEGIVHAAHNLFVHAGVQPKREQVEEFGQIVPKPDLLIWITAPSSQSAEVLLGRGHSRVPAELTAAQTFADHAQQTFAVLSGNADLRNRTFRMDNSAQPGDSSAIVRARARAIGEFLINQLFRQQIYPRVRASA